jgi:hypothetical protein
MNTLAQLREVLTFAAGPALYLVLHDEGRPPPLPVHPAEDVEALTRLLESSEEPLYVSTLAVGQAHRRALNAGREWILGFGKVVVFVEPSGVDEALFVDAPDLRDVMRDVLRLQRPSFMDDHLLDTVR